MWSSGPFMGLKMTKNRSENGENCLFRSQKSKRFISNGLVVYYDVPNPYYKRWLWRLKNACILVNLSRSYV